MSLLPSTQARIDRLIDAVHQQYPKLVGKDLGQMRTVAETILREQDRDTRHACAEAVCFSTVSPSSPETNEAITRAHAACMNSRAI